MVSLFNKTKQTQNSPKVLGQQQEFLKRIKKTLYYGPSNPTRMVSAPMASHVVSHFNDTHKGYDLNILDLPTLSRVRQQTPCSLLLSMIYVDRLLKSDPNFVRLIKPSELFLVTLMVSTKFYSDYDETDVFISNWAEEGEVTLERLKKLEIEFLNAIQWNLLVSQNEFYEKLRTVERLLAMKEGLSRKWFTYTELELLMPSLEIAKKILNYTTILMFSYVCSILTIALSCIIVTSIPPLNTTSITSSTSAGHAGSVNETALLPNVKDQTDCTDIIIENELLLINNQKDLHCNFTIDFSLFNELFESQLRRNYQDTSNFYYGLIHNRPSAPLIW